MSKTDGRFDRLRADGRPRVNSADAPAKRSRSLFISDVHLGTRGCKADLLLEFLNGHDADTIYLVGDIIDAWRLKKTWYWPQAHNDVVQKLLKKARDGSRIIYVPGNHDEVLRNYFGTHFGGIDVQEEAVHHSACGKKYLVVHGDRFDAVVRHAKWLAHLGDTAYNVALWIGIAVSAVRRRLGLSYWSLSAWAKYRVKGAVNFISAFEEALTKAAHRAGVDGVICGHIHHAAIHDRFEVAYLNCGDWVESCTALVESHDGRFEIIRWGIAEPGASVLPFPAGTRSEIKVQRATRA